MTSTLAFRAAGTEHPPVSSISAGRRVRNGVCHRCDLRCAVVVAVVPLVVLMIYLVRKGAAVLRWTLPHQAHPDVPRPHRPGHGAGRRRHHRHHVLGAASWPYRSVSSGPSTSSSTGPPTGWPAFIRFMSDVMAGVPSIVMGLFIYTVFTLKTHESDRLRRVPGPRLPDAADRDPFDRDHAATGAPGSARGQLRPRRAASPAPSSPSSCPPPCPASRAAACWRSPGPRGRRRRCSSPSASSSPSPTGTCSTAPTPRCPPRSSGNAQQPFIGGPGAGLDGGPDPDRHGAHPDRGRPAGVVAAVGEDLLTVDAAGRGRAGPARRSTRAGRPPVASMRASDGRPRGFARTPWLMRKTVLQPARPRRSAGWIRTRAPG